MPYILLAFSIGFEVFGTTMLKVSNGFSRILPVLGFIIGFSLSFYFVSLVLVDLPLGFTYAVWSGTGTIVTVLLSVFLFKEKLNKNGVFGMGMLLAGVVLLNLI